MKNPCRLVLLTLAVLGAIPAAHAGQQVPADVPLSPYFVVKSSDPAHDRLPLKATSASVDIAGVIADVKVTQVYRNEGDTALEAIYVFPGSTRAAIYGMKMTIGTRTIVAKIREKERARKEYEQARQEGRSASLLEQARPNVFQMQVANILPADEITVELSYTELLIPTDGVYEFVYPTVVGPRYSNETKATSADQWVANPTTREGVAPSYAFDFEATISAGLPVSEVSCPSHRTTICEDGPGIARVKLDESEKTGGNRDLILRYQLLGDQIQSGLLLYQGADESFFLLMGEPPKRVDPAAVPPREYIFVMDVSGSMHGFPIEMSKKLMATLLRGLGPDDRFNVLVFEVGSAVLSDQESLQATPENVRKALDMVAGQSGGGGTEMLAAMSRALDLPRTEGMSRTLVIASDGNVSADQRVLDLIRDHLGEANVFAFGIGTSVNRYLMEGIAHVGMGEAFVITDPDAAAAEAERFRTYVESPVLTEVRLAFRGFDAYDIEPTHLPDVLAQRPVICFGKWRGEARGTIELSGYSGRRRVTQTISVAETPPMAAHAALRYLWARHRIQLLGDYRRLDTTGAGQEEITRLGLRYNLLTDTTSFVGVDTTIRAGGEPETVVQPLPLPQGVADSAVGEVTVTGSYQTVACFASGSLGDEVEIVGGRTGGSRTGRVTPKPWTLGRITSDRAALVLDEISATVAARLRAPELSRLLGKAARPLRLELRVDPEGRVVGARLTSGSGDATLDAAILGHLQSWSFAGWPAEGTTVLWVQIVPAE